MKDYSVIDLLENYKLNRSKLMLLNNKQKESKELVDLNENIEKLNICINCLPDEEKEIVKQVYINGITIKKVSKMLIMSRTTVYRRLQKAIEMLEELFKTIKN